MPFNYQQVNPQDFSGPADALLQNALATAPTIQMNKLKLSEAQRNQAELRELQQLMLQTPPDQRQLTAIQWMESKGHTEEAAKLRTWRQELFDKLYAHDPKAAAKHFPDLGVDPEAGNLKVGQKIPGTRQIPYQMEGKRGFLQTEQTPQEMQTESEFKARGSMLGGIKSPEQLQSEVTQAGKIEAAKQGARPIRPDQSRNAYEDWAAAFEAEKGRKPTAAEIDARELKMKTATTQLRIDNPPPAAPGATDARSDRSYQFNTSKLEALAKPIRDRSERLDRVVTTLAQNNAAADALVAPELLTAMAGGQGSGLRMNEAEISRIIGGRTVWENLKASMNRWSLDPQHAQIPPDQRNAMVKLATAMSAKVKKKLAALDEAQQGMINATGTEHRQILADAQRKLTAVDNESGAGGGGGFSIKTPDGKTRTFDSQEQLDQFRKRAGL